MGRKSFLTLLVLSIIFLWMCNDALERSPQRDGDEDGLEVQRQVFPEMTAEQRKIKLAECASCHQNETHNELLGPHSQSYTKLQEHLQMAETSEYFPRQYHKFLEEVSEAACVTCHSSKNLFETNYYGLDTLQDLGSFTSESYPKAWNLPPPRPFGDSRLTGIDCLTCHQKGDRMVTTEDFARNLSLEAPCNPIASKFFSSNLNCVTCHKITVEGMADNKNNSTLFKKMSCNSCHMEKAQSGQFTHYYYWRHDADGKTQFPLLKQTFDDIELKRIPKSEEYAFSWNNSSAPHRFSECAELFVKINFYGKDGKLCQQYTKRLNNKQIHDRSLQSYFGESPVWGEEGCAFLPTVNSCFDTLAVDRCNPKRVEIIGYEKPQYWISDSLAQEVYKKLINL